MLTELFCREVPALSQLAYDVCSGVEMVSVTLTLRGPQEARQSKVRGSGEQILSVKVIEDSERSMNPCLTQEPE